MQPKISHELRSAKFRKYLSGIISGEHQEGDGNRDQEKGAAPLEHDAPALPPLPQLVMATEPTWHALLALAPGLQRAPDTTAASLREIARGGSYFIFNAFLPISCFIYFSSITIINTIQAKCNTIPFPAIASAFSHDMPRMAFFIFAGRGPGDPVPGLTERGTDDRRQGATAEGGIDFLPQLFKQRIGVPAKKILFAEDADRIQFLLGH
ncbi:MAG TPA: hypothetical protein VLQ89_08845, partial [Candidatus Binatia bacterium]|nr:hypothetical protein [Candidatus Binatia bacterium]